MAFSHRLDLHHLVGLYRAGERFFVESVHQGRIASRLEIWFIRVKLFHAFECKMARLDP